MHQGTSGMRRPLKQGRNSTERMLSSETYPWGRIVLGTGPANFTQTTSSQPSVCAKPSCPVPNRQKHCMLIRASSRSIFGLVESNFANGTNCVHILSVVDRFCPPSRYAWLILCAHHYSKKPTKTGKFGSSNARQEYRRLSRTFGSQFIWAEVQTLLRSQACKRRVSTER